MHAQSNRNRITRTANELEQLFNQLFSTSTAPTSSKFSPPSEVLEADAEYVIRLEVPGVKLEDITVEFIDDELRVSGEKKIVCEDSTKVCHCAERRSGQFQRTFRFPTDVEAEKVDARLENGVLTIQLPKAAKVLPRKIEIRSGI
jgi:HSP20 family protein